MSRPLSFRALLLWSALFHVPAILALAYWWERLAGLRP